MYLWRISRIDNVGYDEWDTFIVAAETAEAARRLVVEGPLEPYGPGTNFIIDGARGKWGEPQDLALMNPSWVLPDGNRADKTACDKPFVVLGSFNAG